MEPRQQANISDYAEVTLDLRTVTIGELAAAEMASGESYEALLRSKMGRKLLAMFLHELRTSAQPRPWSELSSLRLLDASSSPSASSPDGVPQTSAD